MNSAGIWQVTAELLAAVGLGNDFAVQPLPGGANNQVFRVDVKGSTALLKVYFQHKDDPRDRLGAEFSFSRFAWDHGVRAGPQPFAYNRERRVGLYEFVPGRQLTPDEVSASAVQQALSFYKGVNRYKRLPEAATLPIASDACFTIADHLQCVERRLRNLKKMEVFSEIDREAAQFVQNELSVAWGDLVASVRKRTGELGLDWEAEIAPEDRRLSPSDFGFHNAILAPDGYLRFIDFEYAGWDDPAKMICDFFCQPAIPVPFDYYDTFVEQVVSDLCEPAIHFQRAGLLLPVYQLKWCCILLNDFSPVGASRRLFANNALDQEKRKELQLQKARAALNRLIEQILNK
jgi:hypothetical protein